MIPYQQFMLGEHFRKASFEVSDEHEHCTMCGIKISGLPANIHEGYVTTKNIHWVCCECFDEYREEYSWKLEDESGDDTLT